MNERRETVDEMLSFVTNLGMSALNDLNEDDYELHIRLESLLVETLREAY